MLALFACAFTGCASDALSDGVGAPAGGSGAVSGMSGGGGGAGVIAGGAGGSGGSATAGSSGAGGMLADAAMELPDGGADAGEVDSGEPREVPATPVDPCTEALDAQPGLIALDVGEREAAPDELEGDPGDDGPYGVLEVNATLPNPDPAREALSVTFYVPQQGGATARMPLVLVMHGFGLTHLSYAHFSRHFASHGLIALGLSLPASLVAAHDKNAAEAIAAIDFALGDSAPAEVRGRVDAERIAAAGHSLGGKIAFYAASLDPRIDLVIGWDPSNAGGPPCFIDPGACNGFPVAPNCLAMDSGLVHALRAESLVFRAAPDGANPEPAHNAIHFYRGAPAPATLVDFADNVLHGDFADPGAAAIAHTKRVQLTLVLDRFGVASAKAYLPGGAQIAAEPLVARVLAR